MVPGNFKDQSMHEKAQEQEATRRLPFSQMETESQTKELTYLKPCSAGDPGFPIFSGLSSLFFVVLASLWFSLDPRGLSRQF